ncbi:MAG: hypothetical protein ACI88H_001423 [Cocleimonas sp.]|jgi:hypothetical protein
MDELTNGCEVFEQIKINRVLALPEDSKDPLEVSGQQLKEDHLVILVDIGMNDIFVINLDSVPRFPLRLNFNDVCKCVELGKIEIVDIEWPRKAILPFSELNERDRKTAEERFFTIEPLVQDIKAVLRNTYGKRLVEQTIEHSGRSKQYVYDSFYAYLRYGQRKTALCLPMGKNIVHIPKSVREINVKQGRPNQRKAAGKVLNEYDIESFKAAKRLYSKTNGPSILSTFKQITRKHYFLTRSCYSLADSKRLNRKYKVELKPASERPSYNQFYYWLVKEYGGNLPRRDKSRQNSIENKKDRAGRTGDAYTHVIAYGQEFELDETPFDEELVSIFDPTRRTKIGKPTLYFVIDSFSKKIAGVFITTDNPSYKTVRQAIFAVACNKTEWLRSLGFSSDFIDLGGGGIPLVLKVDHAEFNNKISEGAVFDLQCMIKFTRKGRGDDKPNIEQVFHVFNQYLKNFSKAHQTKSLQDIANQLARKNAKLTIRELYIIAIVYINYHNNYRELTSFQPDRSMIQDSVRRIPADICKWSLRYRPGYLLHYPDEELYLKLLPKGEVSIQRRGVYFKGTGLWYNCEWILSQGLQEQKSSRNKVILLPCRYNENLVDFILIDTLDGLKVATLDQKYLDAYGGLSFYETQIQKDAEKRNSENYADTQLEHQLGVYELMETLIKNADKEKLSSPMPNIATIKNNRKLEALIDRFSDTNRFLQSYQQQHLHEQIHESADNTDGHATYNDFDDED